MNLAVVLVLSIVISSVVITSNADKAKAYSVAKPVNKIDNVAGIQTIHNEKLSNFTTTFDFTPKTSETSVALRYDYDNDLKKVAIKENFESYKLGDVIYGNITVVSGGARGNVGSIGQWSDQEYNAFKGTDYEATFWIHQNNSDWGKMNIKLKKNVQLIYLGAKHGGESNKIALYADDTTVNGLPDSKKLLTSFDLYDYGYNYNKGEVYYQLKVTKDNIKLYISPVNDFDGLEPVINYTLSDELATAESELTFSQGNTGLLIDDLKVIDVTKAGYETTVNTTRFYEKVFEEDFESADAVIPTGGSKIVKFGNDNMLDFNSYAWNVNADFANDLPKNSIIKFYIIGNNADWENIQVYFHDDLNIQFQGGRLDGNNGKYTVRLLNGSQVLETVQDFGNLNAGTYIKIECLDGIVKIYSDKTGEFVDTVPLFNKEINGLSDNSKFMVCKNGNTVLRIDDIEVYDLDNYTEEVEKSYSGEYGCITISNSGVVLNEVFGEEFNAIKSEGFKFKVGKEYKIAILRDRNNITVNIDGKKVLSGKTQYDEETFFGDVDLSVSGAAVSNVVVYDSGRIAFDERGAVLVPYKLSDDIKPLAKSSDKNKITQFDKDLNISVDAEQNNSALCTSAFLEEDAGDIVLDFYINDSRNDWINDTIFIGVPSNVENPENRGYQYDPSVLYKEGYAVEFGANSADSP